MTIDDNTRTELEAAVFRRLVEHLRQRTDVQNLDLMNLAGFCRNCLSNWMKDAADAKGLAMTKDASREAVYGMPYEEWKAKHQSDPAANRRLPSKRPRTSTELARTRTEPPHASTGFRSHCALSARRPRWPR